MKTHANIGPTRGEVAGGQRDAPGPRVSLPEDRPSVLIVGVLAVLALAGYVLSRGILPFWLWLAFPVIGGIRNLVLFLQRRKSKGGDPPGRSTGQTPPRTHRIAGNDSVSDHTVPARMVLHEFDLRGLQAIIGFAAREERQVHLAISALGDGVAGIAVLHSVSRPSPADLKREFRREFQNSSSAQDAAARFLQTLDRQYGAESVFVGIWETGPRFLSYFAAGFEPPSVINVGWPHCSDAAIDRDTDNGPQRISFGIHNLSPGDRWLLYAKPLVDVPNAQREPFNSTGIVQYAYDTCGMPGGPWVKYLLGLGIRAHGGSLPTGSILMSLTCGQAEATVGRRGSYASVPTPPSRPPGPRPSPALRRGDTGPWRVSSARAGRRAFPGRVLP